MIRSNRNMFSIDLESWVSDWSDTHARKHRPIIETFFCTSGKCKKRFLIITRPTDRESLSVGLVIININVYHFHIIYISILDNNVSSIFDKLIQAATWVCG